MAKLHLRIKKMIYQTVGKSRKNYSRLQIGGKSWLHWHCGRRMIKVKVLFRDYEALESGKIKEIRGVDEFICADCLHHYTDDMFSYRH